MWFQFEPLINSLGFDFFVYTIARYDSKQFYYYDNYGLHPEDESEFYDPFLDYCCNSYETMFTGMEFLADNAHFEMNQQYLDLIEKGGELGMVSGIAIPLKLKGSNRFGGFNIGSSLKRTDFETHVANVLDTAQLVCMLTHKHIEMLLDKNGILTEQSNSFAAHENPKVEQLE